MNEYIYIDELGYPYSFYENEIVIKNNYKRIENKFYLELAAILGYEKLRLCPIQLKDIYEAFWNTWNDYSGGLELRKKLDVEYNLFKESLTWFTISGGELLNVVNNMTNGVIKGYWCWKNTSAGFRLHFLSQKI